MRVRERERERMRVRDAYMSTHDNDFSQTHQHEIAYISPHDIDSFSHPQQRGNAHIHPHTTTTCHKHINMKLVHTVEPAHDKMTYHIVPTISTLWNRQAHD